jgi:acyl-CoA oxidase
MEAVKTKYIRKMVNQLCWEIEPDTFSLVKAFDIQTVVSFRIAL